MNRLAQLSLFILIIFGNIAFAQGDEQTPAHILAAGKRALAHIGRAAAWTHTLLPEVKTTALGCRLIDGLPLPNTIEVYRLELIIESEPYALHISSDGTMTQICDQRFEMGTGLITAGANPERDSDGDRLENNADLCPNIAGLLGAKRIGCPQSSRDDRDGDGTPDSIDFCPDQAGSPFTGGCSLFNDADGDGVPDADDICEYDYGIIHADFALGCPDDGSGSSSRRRHANDICGVKGASLRLFDGAYATAKVIGIFENANQAAGDSAVIGRDATGSWYQLGAGWVSAAEARLQGACYNIPLVNVVAGATTGCYMRPRESSVNVRLAPRDKQVAQIHSNNSYAVLGNNFAGDWLFFRQGWVSRSVLELSGTCDELPVLDPDLVASGTVHFCPPGYKGLLPPRIDLGVANARIASHTFANRLRAFPQLKAELIGEIAPRTIVDAVLDGPACDGAFVWWQVEVDGAIGWTVESDLNANVYYLEPVAAELESQASQSRTVSMSQDRKPSDLALPTTWQMISSAHADTIDAISLLPLANPLAIAWSPLQSRLALLSASDSIKIYSYPSLEHILTIDNVHGITHPTAIAFSADDRFLAIGNEAGRVSLVEFADEAVAASALMPQLHGSPVRALAWSHQSNTLAAVSGAKQSQLGGSANTLKVWQVEAPDDLSLLLNYSFPHPLTDVAISKDDRWLAVTGESEAKRRAAIWIYDKTDYDLVFSKSLVYMGGNGLVESSPAAELGDFVYNNGDSLYHIAVSIGGNDGDNNGDDNADDMRFYHLAGTQLSQLAFRREVLPGAEIYFALSSLHRDGSAQLRLVNALNGAAPVSILKVNAGAIAFSPDGRLLAVAEAEKDRVLILGVADR